MLGPHRIQGPPRVLSLHRVLGPPRVLGPHKVLGEPRVLGPHRVLVHHSVLAPPRVLDCHRVLVLIGSWVLDPLRVLSPIFPVCPQNFDLPSFKNGSPGQVLGSLSSCRYH